MHDLIIQQRDPAAVQPAALFLLFHGVGSNAQDLQSLGRSIAVRHPEAWIVCVQSPDASDLGRGWQWFSVLGVTDDNRAQRVATAMPAFVKAVTGWQHLSGVDPQHTTLVGFSQGAIMALESTQVDRPVAARVAAMAGRFAAPPRRAPECIRVHLMHGEADGVVPAQASIEALGHLTAMHADVTLDLFPGLGHGIDGRMAARLHEHLATAA